MSHRDLQNPPAWESPPEATITLTEGDARCTVDYRRGAFVSSLVLGGRELLKTPDPNTSWPGGGIPVLFPFAGRNWASEPGKPRELHQWTWEGITRPMPIHGFVHTAESPPWTLGGPLEGTKGSKALRLQCRDTHETRKIYPFTFTLELELTLNARSLDLALITTGGGDTPLPLAPGFHPYFAQRCTNEFTFESGKTANFHRVTPDGNVGESGAVELPRSLDDALLHNLILKNDQRTWTVRHRPSARALLHLQHSGAWTVLWAKPELDFICIEPWTSLPDAAKRSPLAGGALLLAPGERHELRVRIALD
jgi:galactose mutarotase-like enzyme